MTAAAPESPAARFRALLSDLGDAVRGTALDYTKGSLGRAVLLLSVPMMLEMVMESVFAVVDVYFVSTLGSSAVATVGLTESVLTLVYAVGIGLSMGATALVARRIGEKEPEAAADTAVQCIVVAVAASIPFAIAGIFFSRELLTLMGADAWSIEHGSRYTAWMLGGNVVIMLIFIGNAIGETSIPVTSPWDPTAALSAAVVAPLPQTRSSIRSPVFGASAASATSPTGAS
jgi:Na+-driven multidrug efflux pump